MEARCNADFFLTPELENSMEIVYERTHTNVSYLQLILFYWGLCDKLKIRPFLVLYTLFMIQLS